MDHKPSLSRRRSARSASGVATRQRSLFEQKGKVGCSALNNYWTSHLGGAGEPPGATRRPRGRPWRPPECPDGHGRLRPDDPRGGKGVKTGGERAREGVAEPSARGSGRGELRPSGDKQRATDVSTLTQPLKRSLVAPVHWPPRHVRGSADAHACSLDRGRRSSDLRQL